MSGDQKKDRDALARLTKALVEDIFETPDAEILAEAAADGVDPDALANDARALFERTLAEQGKAKLAAAKSAAVAARQQGVVVKLDPAEAKRRYEAKIAQDKELSDKLTMAARKGKGQSERDIESAIEDLAELGAFDEEDSEQ